MGLSKLEQCIEFLNDRGVQKTKHSGRTLYVHLKRTFDILKAANLSEDVCFAGLFHSIYGNNIFTHKAVEHSERQTLKALIGDYSELLVWTFCALERPFSLQTYVKGEKILKHSDGSDWVVNEKDAELFEDLLSIEAANLLDQQVLWRNKWLVPHAKKVGLLTESGFNVLRESKTYVESRQREINGMLDSARQGAREILISKLNYFRSMLASDSVFGADLRKIKLQQALIVLDADAKGLLNELDVEVYDLMRNYAESYGVSLVDAAKHVVNLCSAFETSLYKSELLKDKYSGKLVKANTLAEIDLIKCEIIALTNELLL